MKPYMYKEEIEFMSKELDRLKDGAIITEWGSGGSTLMILDHLKPNQKYFSIEHDTKWGKKVFEQVNRHPNRDQLFYIITGMPKLMTMVDGREQIHAEFEFHKENMIGKFLEENPSYIGNYIDPTYLHEDFADVMNADFFLVDGLARGAVLATIIVKAKKKAKIILHDYVGREDQYEWAKRLFRKVKIFKTMAILTI